MPNDTVWIENAGIYLIFDSNKKIDTTFAPLLSYLLLAIPPLQYPRAAIVDMQRR